MPAAAPRRRRSALAARGEAIRRGWSGNMALAHDRPTHDVAVRRRAEPPLEGKRSLLDQHR